MSAKSIFSYIICFMWLLLVSGSVFTMTDRFAEPILTPKWYVMEAVMIAGGLLLVLLSWGNRPKIVWQTIYQKICWIANIAAFVEALWAISQYAEAVSRYMGFAVGTFDNIAGLTACLVISFPMGFIYFKEYNLVKRLVFVLIKLTSFLAIGLYHSRIGLLCMLLILILVFFHEKKQRVVWAILFTTVALPVSALIIKTNSTHGRWFIIERTIDMIKEHPLSGWGHHGFMANYMNVQADYFASHPDSPYSMIADNIHHPLNEYLLVAVNYGVPAAIGIVLLLLLAFAYYQNHQSAYTREGIRILLMAALLSTCSYPSAYPFSLLITVVSLILIFHERLTFRNLRYLYVPCLFAIICYGYHYYKCVEYELRWKDVMYKATYGQAKQMMSQYESLLEGMGKNPNFLYNYAYEQYRCGKYEDALKTIQWCEKLDADYSIQLLKGMILRSLGHDQESLSCYKLASNMCPSRILPLYEIYCVYQKMGLHSESQKIYKQIMHKPLKVKSDEVKEILQRLEQRNINKLQKL